MPFLEYSLSCPRQSLGACEDALSTCGALAVTLADAHAETADEHAIFEPGVGETPLWDALVMTALFDAGTDAAALLVSLTHTEAAVAWSEGVFRIVEDQDWERAWLENFQPMRFGARTWIVPWNQPLPDAVTGDSAVVRLDPGLAFGSGTHATTALCLEWLDALGHTGALEGQAITDFGCGSGILALAALKLGAAHALAIDNDPQAILATRDNAERNGLATQITAALADEAPITQAPVVVANILATALDVLAPRLAEATQPGGRIALSGILDGQQDALLHRYAEWFESLQGAERDGWIRIDGRRRA